MSSTRSIARFSYLLVLLNLGIFSNAFVVLNDQTALALERVDKERVADLPTNEDFALPDGRIMTLFDNQDD